jgi:hypothetical protein
MFAAVLLGAVALGTALPGWHTFSANGLSVRYPPGWFATRQPLTPVTSPPQVLAVASYLLPRNDRGADGCEPKEALDRMPPTGAFIFGWEYGSVSGRTLRQFPPRPKHFKLTRFAHFECLGPSYVLLFRQVGRFFQIHVAFGRRASRTTRATVLRILDSLSVRR